MQVEHPQVKQAAFSAVLFTTATAVTSLLPGFSLSPAVT